MRERSPRPAARLASGTSFRASTDTSTASRRWPRSLASITSALAPTSRCAWLRRGLYAVGAFRRGDAARRLQPRAGGQDRRRQLPAHLSCCGRLKLPNSARLASAVSGAWAVVNAVSLYVEHEQR